MKSSTHDHLFETSKPIEKSQRKLLGITRKMVRPLMSFWRFSCYYGNFIAYRQ